MSWETYRPVYELMGAKEWLPVSVNQKATIQEFLRIGSYVIFYIVNDSAVEDWYKNKEEFWVIL